MALDNADMIAQIAAQKLGPAPAGAPPQGAAPPAPPPPPKADPAPTNMEKAQAKVAPNDPSAESAQTPINFMKIGDKEYTEDQLKGTLGRYKDLNYKWQTNKPVMDIVGRFTEAARAAGHDPKPEEIAALVDSAVKAYIKDPQFGGQKQAPNQKGSPKDGMSSSHGDSENEGGGDQDAMYEQWEKENAVKLPPGFKENAATTKGMSAKMDQMMEMFQKVIQGGLAGQKSQDDAAQQVQQAQGQQADAATQMISNNLTMAFQKAGIQADPQTRGDFRMFAAQRGYDFPDFMDSGLTATVVADYKANKDAPEVARLREVAQKRQAFTGMVEGAPGAGGAAPAAPADSMLAGMIQTAMGQKGM